jgi:protein SCO1/2
MDHSSIVYLMGPDGRFVRHFPYGTSADDMRNALQNAINS